MCAEPVNERERKFESIELQMEIVIVSGSECVSVSVLAHEAPLRSEEVNELDAVNAFDCINVFDSENLFDSVNVFDLVNVFDCVNVSDCVNVFDCVNVSENVSDYVNVCVGGRHSSIVPVDTFSGPNSAL